MLPTAATASARSRRRSSSALSGSPRMLLRAASAVNAMPEQGRPELVVEVAAQPAPFLFDGGDRRSAGLLEVLSQGTGAQRLGQQRSRDPQHVLVACGQGQVARPQADHDLADRVWPQGERQPPGVGDRGSRGGELGAAGGQTRVRQHEGLADGAGREYGVIADPVGDPGRGVERVWPAAEEQFVGDAAQRDAQPVEADCVQGGDEREDTLRLVVPPCEVQAGQ